MGTGSELERARTEIQAASEHADGEVREQLLSLDEGVLELVGGDKTRDEPLHADRLEELAEKLAGLEAKVDEPVRTRLQSAREHVDAYRESVGAE